MIVFLPPVRNHLYSKYGNTIVQSFISASEVDDFEFVSLEPFVLKSGENRYLFTSKHDSEIPEDFNFALLTFRKPQKKDFVNNTLPIKQWLKNPAILPLTPDEVRNSWKDKFKFVKENVAQNIQGLRPPQIGALYSILAHVQNPEDRAIIVMPTGTGKTEVMLSALIANQCPKLLVTVPSDSLRTQLANKFISLGLLKQFKIIADDCYNPQVGIMTTKFTQLGDLKEFISKVNVVVTTMSLLTGYGDEAKAVLAHEFSHLFIDEAHHSEANTWKNLIGKFNYKKVFLFTATPFRTDEKRLKGKFIFNFSLRNAQEQQYYKKINYLPIREYDPKKADERIAEQAVTQLRKDILAGFNHIIMARCATKI